MAKRLYVGNLPEDVAEDDLLALFSEVGTVEKIQLARDPGTGLSAGYAYVEMATDEEADNAIHKLDGIVPDDREIRVREALPEETGHPPSPGGLTSAG